MHSQRNLSLGHQSSHSSFTGSVDDRDDDSQISIPLKLTCSTFPSPTTGQHFLCASIDSLPCSTSSSRDNSRFPLDIIALVDTSQVSLVIIGEIWILGPPVLFVASILGPFRESCCTQGDTACINDHELPLVFLAPGVGNQRLHPCLFPQLPHLHRG